MMENPQGMKTHLDDNPPLLYLGKYERDWGVCFSSAFKNTEQEKIIENKCMRKTV